MKVWLKTNTHKLCVLGVSVLFAMIMATMPVSASATKEVTEEVVELTDEDPALAPSLPVAERAKLSWWWLFFATICGAIGYIWYRNHHRDVENEDFE